MTDELITQKEAANIRGVTVSAITDLVKRGRIRSEERYGKVLVYRSEVENFKEIRAGWPKGKSRKVGAAGKKKSVRK
jgi:excisionase family DNA binding protein